MTTAEARHAAAEWVRQQITRYPEAIGAVVAGSTRTRAADSPHPAGSDVDLFLFVEATVPSDIHEPRNRFAPRKLAFRGFVLEPSFHELRRINDPAAVASDLHLAPVLAEPCILWDPTGRLQALAAAVRPEVLRHCHAQRRLAQALALATPSKPYAAVPDAPGLRAACWHNVVHAFSIMRCAVAILVAHQTTPTTRRSLVVAREILRAAGHENVADELLRLLGSFKLNRPEVEALATEAEQTYDLAVRVRHTAVPLEWNVSPDARELERAAIREMIVAGEHREVLFQLLLVRTIAQGLIENDGDEAMQTATRRGFRRLLTALGIDGDERLQARGQAVIAFLPTLRSCCEALLARDRRLRD